MCKQVLFWVTEYLNYFSLIFWGIKLFLKKYDVHTAKKGWIENVIIIWIYQCAESACPVFWKSPVRKEEIMVSDR